MIGAARATHEILQRVPQANVVLVRTLGVWGSMFSYARTGAAPPLGLADGAVDPLDDGQPALSGAAAQRPHPHRGRASRPTSQRGPRPAQPLSRTVVRQGRCGATDVCSLPSRSSGRATTSFPSCRIRSTSISNRISAKTRLAVNEMIEEHLGRPLTPQEKEPEATLDLLGLDSLERMETGPGDRRPFRISLRSCGQQPGRALGPGRRANDRLGAEACRPSPVDEDPAARGTGRSSGRHHGRGLRPPRSGRRRRRGGRRRHERRAHLSADARRRDDHGSAFGRTPRRGGRRHVAGVGCGRPRVLRLAHGRQVAGDAQLDHRTGQPGPRRPHARHQAG